jgi:hypothetical protein
MDDNELPKYINISYTVTYNVASIIDSYLYDEEPEKITVENLTNAIYDSVLEDFATVHMNDRNLIWTDENGSPL